MVRYETNTSPIRIAYGSDHLTGIFLAVYDNRIHDGGSLEEVRNVSYKLGTTCNGSGGYLDLHTGLGGFGLKVSMVTMVVYMRRYGVPEKHILELCGKEAVDQAAGHH